MAADETVEQFVRLLAQNQRRIYLYVATLVPNPTDAEEVVQNANLVLWREFPTFQPGTNFAAWACRVAFNQVLAWRKKRSRDRLEFSEAFLTAVATDAADRADELESRSAALAKCVEKLPADQRALLDARYSDGNSIEAVAARVGRTVEATYRALSRIRHTLHECVTRTLAAEMRA
jgi:RNA polymerase sigma-70 factor (ECF subfamily)